MTTTTAKTTSNKAAVRRGPRPRTPVVAPLAAPELRTRTVTLENGSSHVLEVSSGNVFRDLGLPDADALLYKSNLIIRIRQIIEERGLTQQEAAGEIGLSQPDLSKLLRGRFEKISTDKLFDILNRLGQTVEIRVTSKGKGGTFVK